MSEATFTQCEKCGAYASGPCECDEPAEKPAKPAKKSKLKNAPPAPKTDDEKA